MLGNTGSLKTVAARGFSTFRGGFSRRGFGDCFSGGNYYMNGNNPIFYLHGILLAVLVVIIIILLVRKSKKNKAAIEAQALRKPVFSDKELALQILNKRYANGEIDDDEYVTKKQNLTNDFSLNNSAEGNNLEEKNYKE